jgi:uncharacterized integral membrane protein
MRIVHSLDELLQLPGEPGVNGYRAREALRLEIPRLSSDVSTRAQDSLNRLQERCGSLVASSAMFLTLVVGVFKVFDRNSTFLSWAAVFEFAVVLLVSFAMGGLAKMAALAVTRWQFTRRCREHYEKLSQLVHGTAAR